MQSDENNTQELDTAFEELKDSAFSKHNFDAKSSKQTANSVTIEWQLLPTAEVYQIEQHHRRRGWTEVVWTSRTPAAVENLDENFAYKLRIKALKYKAEAKAYEPLAISTEFVVRTLAAEPSNLCLHRAIRKGQQFLVKRILRRRPSLIECPGPNGYLPLANAIAYGEHCIIDVLLTAGASVHVGNPQIGRTPLHLAFYHGRLSVARILLNKRADLEAADAYGMTACHFAVDANRFDILKFALECGANVEARDACGWTLLLRAVVMQADVAILKLLLVHGANPKALDLQEQSCKDLARLYKNHEAIKYFAQSLKMKERD